VNRYYVLLLEFLLEDPNLSLQRFAMIGINSSMTQAIVVKIESVIARMASDQ
jgi:hypothetical protein